MVFKCKMCGGDIAPIENTNTGKCLYCKSVMTLPNLDNEKIINLYNRANDLRLENEFDKAYGVYETILEIDNQQIEARWGLILCKYGVEYVDDVKTKKKMPTCHRTIEQIITNDVDYKYIIKNAYGDALELYKKEAEEIKEIQKRIKEVSVKEKPYDVFICYKETDDQGERTHDSLIAEDIYEALTKEGYKVFFARITLEDKLGTEYEPYIYSALISAKVMLVVGTAEDNFNSVWVKNEWSRYLEFMRKDKNKVMIPVYSKLDAYKLPEEFVNLQAQSMDKIGAMQDLVRGVKKILTTPDKQNNLDAELEKRLEEATDGVKKLGNGRFEVAKLKEKLPIWYYLLLAALTGIIIFVLGIFLINYIPFMEFYTFNYVDITVTGGFRLLLIALFILVIMGGIAKIKSRNIYKIANFLYLMSIILLLVFPFIGLKNYLLASPLWIILILLILLIAIINPSWHIDSSSKIIVNEEEKNKIVTKNDEIRNNFTRKCKVIGLQLTIVITLLIASIVYFGWVHNILNTSYENGRDKNAKQIKVVNNGCLRKEKNNNSLCLAPIQKGDYYTIIDVSFEDIECGIWYQVKNSKNVSGFICGSDNSTRNSNVRTYGDRLK